MMINIMEEYVLVELIQINEFPGVLKVIEDKYEATLKVDQMTESVWELKLACLGMMATLIIIYLSQCQPTELLKIFNVNFPFILINHIRT